MSSALLTAIQTRTCEKEYAAGWLQNAWGTVRGMGLKVKRIYPIKVVNNLSKCFLLMYNTTIKNQGLRI